MWIAIVSSLLFSLLVLMGGTTDSLQREVPRDILAMKVEAGKVALFKQAADLYVAANPAVTGDIGWATIKTVANFPPALAGATIDPAWKIVGDGAGGYTLCATTRDGASLFLADAMTFVQGVNAYRSGSSKTVLTNNPGIVNTEASKC
jgi:hypothetical protein